MLTASVALLQHGLALLPRQAQGQTALNTSKDFNSRWQDVVNDIRRVLGRLVALRLVTSCCCCCAHLLTRAAVGVVAAIEQLACRAVWGAAWAIRAAKAAPLLLTLARAAAAVLTLAGA